MIKNKNQLRIESVIDIFNEEVLQEVKDTLIKLSNLDKSINYKKLMFKRDQNLILDFTDYKSLKEFFKEIYYRKILIDRAEDIRKEFNNVLQVLQRYSPRNLE